MKTPLAVLQSRRPLLLAAAAAALVTYAPGGAPAQAASPPPAAGDNGLSTFVALPSSASETAEVNVANGNLLVSDADGAQAEGTAAQLSLVRYYNSQDSPAPGAVAAADWSFSAGPEVTLALSGSTVTVQMPSGASAQFTRNTDGSYSSSNTTAKLSLANGVYTLVDPFGNTETFKLVNGSSSDYYEASQESPGDSAPTTVDSNTSSDQSVSYLSDLINATDGTYLYINHPDYSLCGCQTPPVQSVNDSAGGTATYGYTGNELTSFTTYTGAQTGYGYDSSGRLDSITEPDGTQELVTYNSTNQATSLKIVPPGGSAYGYTFSYSSPTSPTCQSTDAGQTVVTAISGGDAATYCYTSAGGVDHYADSAPPDPVTDIAAEQVAAGGDVNVSWDPPPDPSLPDGSPGPSIASYTYQYEIGSGAWSAPATTQQAGFTIPGASVPSAAQLTVKLTAVNSAGASGATATLQATVDVSGTNTLTTTLPSNATMAAPDTTAATATADAQAAGAGQNAYQIWTTFPCQCYNGQKTIAYRYGYYNRTTDSGFGRAKVLNKHNMWARVVRFIVSTSGHKHDGGTAGSNIAYAHHSGSDGDYVIKLYAVYDTRLLNDHRSFGVVTAYCEGYTRCPLWVNTAAATG